MGNAIIQTSHHENSSLEAAKYVVSGQDTLEEVPAKRSPAKKDPPKPQQQDVYFISAPNLKTTDKPPLPSIIKEVVLPALSSSAKKPSKTRTTIILSKARETEVAKAMQFTQLASHMRVTHQSRSLSKLAPFRDCSLTLNRSGTHNI